MTPAGEMPRDLGGRGPNLRGLKGGQPRGRPTLTFPPSPSASPPGTRGASPTQGKAGPAGPEGQPPLLSPSAPAGAGGRRLPARRGSGRTGITWGRSATAGASAGRAKPGSAHGAAGGRDAGRREARRAPKASDAAGPAAGEDKAPRSPAPPPPASQPATQRHAHGRRRLGTLLAAPPPGSAHRPRPPRPFPARGDSARRERTWPPAPGARRDPLAPAARSPWCARDPVSAREETETSCKSDAAPGAVAPGPGECVAPPPETRRSRPPPPPPEPWISEVCTDPLRNRTEALGSSLRLGML
ncbi:unnamed protein product [Nyctereutes procyonoides]|uniref:(raccoon dog) hypothetical protein n=1 Tax=Nyctereutes procyonoides TaxID=34880 RepID=A0A811Y5G2_NYCPR|nr:unnamed protein product [Nyctereutes procyonoides]